MLKRRRTLRVFLTALSASACLLAGASCAGPSFSRHSGDGAAAPPAPPGREESPRLYRVWLEGKVGFIDRTGKLVIPPKFESNYVWGEFADGMARVKVNTLERPGYCCRFGYINSEGLAAVYEEGDRQGYIDKTGAMVLRVPYHGLGPFSEGLASVVVDEDTQGFIDRAGRLVFKGKMSQEPTKFSEGLAPVEFGDKWGYIDRAGRVVIKPQFDQAYDFSGGLAMVFLPGKKMGYIDRTGNYVWRPTN